MSANSQSIAPHLQTFFAEHLCHHKRASSQTILSCRDTFRLFLTFLRDATGKEPTILRITDLDAPAVLRFLEYLEQQRGNTVRSRNIRLSAIRSFFRWLVLREPECIGIATRVLAIPIKREDKKRIAYLTREEIDALIDAPDRTQWSGRRDHALLQTMYNSGARVSELTGLERDQVSFGAHAFLQLIGKGRKQRTIPLWPHTARTLKAWFAEVSDTCRHKAFPNARGKEISRYGVNYLLQRAAQRAKLICPSLEDKKIHPHLVRHTTAVHLLQAGVDIAVIALWLGHECIETTHVYLDTDLATKERALNRLEVTHGTRIRFKADDDLLRFLASL